MVAAFGGWNDAGDAATGVIDHLVELGRVEFAFELDPEDFYDYQENRPLLTREHDGTRSIQWQTTEVLVLHLEERDLVLVSGPEPNMRWRTFCQRLLSAFRSVKPERVITLGALLADSPHRRPVPVSIDDTSYEGPTGIVGVLSQTCLDAGIPVTSIWASVPHYVAEPPNPKATLALLGALEDVIDTTLEARDLTHLAGVWESRVNELADDDPDVATYISDLEERHDEEQADGDQIAAEFERYLRRRDR